MDGFKASFDGYSSHLQAVILWLIMVLIISKLPDVPVEVIRLPSSVPYQCFLNSFTSYSSLLPEFFLWDFSAFSLAAFLILMSR